MSYTFTLTGKTSVITGNFNPPIILENDSEYVVGLTNFESYNTIPNIEKGKNNKLYFGKVGEYIEIPEGTYEISELNSYLQKALSEDRWRRDKDRFKTFHRGRVLLEIKANNNTLKCSIKSNEEIDFTKTDSVGSLLGFKPRILQANVWHEADHAITIYKLNAILIDCNIASGSYLNSKPVHVVHEFFPQVPPGFKIVECPSTIIYLPVSVRVIDEIVIKILDQDRQLVNFRGELITVRLHLKKV